MTPSEMTDAIVFLEAFDPAAANRIRYAGLAGYKWPFKAVEFMAKGYTLETMASFAQASSFAALELQCVLEAFRAERQGGKLIR